MSNFTDSAQSKQIDQQEHNHDAGAKRVVMRYQDPNTGEWLNTIPDLTPGVDYDNLLVTNTSSTTDTVEFRLSGTPVRTLDVTYTNSDVDKISDELVSIDFS